MTDVSQTYHVVWHMPNGSKNQTATIYESREDAEEAATKMLSNRASPSKTFEVVSKTWEADITLKNQPTVACDAQKDLIIASIREFLDMAAADGYSWSLCQFISTTTPGGGKSWQIRESTPVIVDDLISKYRKILDGAGDPAQRVDT